MHARLAGIHVHCVAHLPKQLYTSSLGSQESYRRLFSGPGTPCHVRVNCSAFLFFNWSLDLIASDRCMHIKQATTTHKIQINQPIVNINTLIVPNSQCPVLVLVPAMSSHRCCPCLRPALLFLLRSSTLVFKFADDCQTNNAYVPSPCLRLSCPRLRPVPVSVPVRPGFPLTSFSMIV